MMFCEILHNRAAQIHLFPAQTPPSPQTAQVGAASAGGTAGTTFTFPSPFPAATSALASLISNQHSKKTGVPTDFVFFFNYVLLIYLICSLH